MSESQPSPRHAPFRDIHDRVQSNEQWNVALKIEAFFEFKYELLFLYVVSLKRINERVEDFNQLLVSWGF